MKSRAEALLCSFPVLKWRGVHISNQEQIFFQRFNLAPQISVPPYAYAEQHGQDPKDELDSPDPLPKIGQHGYAHDDGGCDADHDGEEEDGNVGPAAHGNVEPEAVLLAPPLLRSKCHGVVTRSHQWGLISRSQPNIPNPENRKPY